MRRGDANLAKQGEKTMTKTAQKTKTATTTDPIRRFWYDDELPFQSLAYQAKKLFELLRPHGTPRSSTT